MDDQGGTPPSVARPQQLRAHEDRVVTVSVRGAVKTYGEGRAVLRGLDMSVPEGTIYGLLGPSGCGKTTLLSVIVGKTELDSGDIIVNASRREEIGYMPQHLNLHKNLTILQTFKFYGLMFNMDVNTIIERLKELTALLMLPTHNCLIDNLSGGQQRRISLGVALLHNPSILILDEPTVGLDPILSQSIWNYLASLAEEGKTIIITTHYIEEARQAHTIGMMRDGILVAQESPEMLIARCNTTTLEDAFLELSKKQNMLLDNQFDGSLKYPRHKKSNNKLNFKEGILRKNRINSLLYKNMCLFIQQKPFTALLILLPLVTAYCFNLAIGPDPQGLNIAVVNNELQQRQTEECAPDYYNGCFLNRTQDFIMSCAYIKQMQSKSLNIIHYDDVESAVLAVKRNHVWGLLYFPENYTTSMAVRYTSFGKISEAQVDSSIIQASLDLSNQFIGNIIKAKMYFGMLKYLGESLTQCNISTKVGTPPISFREPVFGSSETNFVHYSSAAMLCLGCYFLPALFTVGLILTEKEEGMMERMMVSGIRFSEVLVSTVIVQFAVHIVQTAISMYVMYVYFDNPYIGDHVPTITILMLIGMEGMLLGFFVAAICDNFMIAIYVGAGINMSYCITSGLVWPLEGSHYLLRMIGPFLPMNAPIKAFVAITSKGWSFDSRPVYLGLISIFCWSCITVLGIFIIRRFNKDLWVSKK